MDDIAELFVFLDLEPSDFLLDADDFLELFVFLDFEPSDFLLDADDFLDLVDRFENIDPVPRIKKTQEEIKRTLTPDTVLHHQQHWLKINPNRKDFFEDPTGP